MVFKVEDTSTKKEAIVFFIYKKSNILVTYVDFHKVKSLLVGFQYARVF